MSLILWYRTVSGEMIHGGSFSDWVSLFAVVPLPMTENRWIIRSRPSAYTYRGFSADYTLVLIQLQHSL